MPIYLDPHRTFRRLGSALCTENFRRNEQHGPRVYLAGIASPDDRSRRFHRKHRFTEVGTFRHYALKWGRPISSAWLRRCGGDDEVT